AVRLGEASSAAPCARWPAFVWSAGRPPPCPPLFPYTTLFRSVAVQLQDIIVTIVIGVTHPAFDRSGKSRIHRKIHKIEMPSGTRSEEHTSELQSCFELVCRLLLETKKRRRSRRLSPRRVSSRP